MFGLEEKVAAAIGERVHWGEPLQGTARDLLADAEADPEVGERRDAADWLRELLVAEPVAAKEVQRLAEQDGFAWRNGAWSTCA